MPGLGNAWQAAGIRSSRLDVLVGEDRQDENTSYCSDDKGEEKGRWGFNAFSAVIRGGAAEHRDRCKASGEEISQPPKRVPGSGLKKDEGVSRKPGRGTQLVCCTFLPFWFFLSGMYQNKICSYPPGEPGLSIKVEQSA